MTQRSLAHVAAHVAFVLLVLAGGGAASAGEGVVALQSAEPSCNPGGGVDVYHPCDNGTVTDTRSGLVWLANADCFGQVTWHEAMEIVAGLGDLPFGACTGAFSEDECDCSLRDGSSPGEWRLPTLSEWQTMVELADTMDCEPTITNDFGTSCWVEGCFDLELCSFYNVQDFEYWAASPSAANTDHAWFLNLRGGNIGVFLKTNHYRMWPVRGGQ